MSHNLFGRTASSHHPAGDWSRVRDYAWNHPAWRYGPTAGLLALATFVLLWRLGQASLHNWDEAIYAQIAKEILQTDDWITLHWGFRHWIDKPPLLMWITAIFFKCFGVTEFWARAASAFSGIGVVLTTYLIGKRLYNRWVGFVSAILLLTSFDFIKWARNGMLDVMLALLTYLAIYGYIRSERGSSKWWYFIWTMAALAIMLKALAAFIAPVTIFLVLLFNRRFGPVLRLKDFWAGAGLAVLIAAPWHILMYLRFGLEFVEKYFGYQISYATTVLDNHAGNVFFYVEKLAAGFAPWSFLAIFALWFSLKENYAGEKRSQILVILIALVLVVYTLSETKLSTYMVPVYPSLAILTAGMLGPGLKQKGILVIGGFIVGFCLTVLIMLPGWKGMLLLGVTGIAILVPTLLVKQAWHLPAVVMFGCLLVSTSLNLRPLYSEGTSPIARLAQTAAGAKQAVRQEMIVYSNLWAPAALYYFDRPVDEVRDPETLSRLIEKQPKDIVLWKDDAVLLDKDFRITVLSEVGALVFAEISKE